MHFKNILWEKGGPLTTVWIAANLGRSKSLKIKLSRRDYCRVSIVEASEAVMTPEADLPLQLSSHLLLGIVRIHNKQTHYVLQESKELMRCFNFLSKKFTVARFRAVTQPEFNFSDISFTPLCDLSFSEMEDLSGYFTLETPHLGGPDDATLRANAGGPNVASLKSSPFIADPKDISITEQPNQVNCSDNVLEDSLWDSMYFGDEDPNLLADAKKTLSPTSNLLSPSRRDSANTSANLVSEAQTSPVATQEGDNELDLVLMVNEEGSFEYSSGGADTSNSSREGSESEKSEAFPSTEKLRSTANGFEIPCLTNDGTTPLPLLNTKTTPPSRESKIRDGNSPAEGKVRIKNPKKRKRKWVVFDVETKLCSRRVKQGLKNPKVGLKEADYTKQLKRMTKATDLLHQPFSNSVKHHVLASECKASLPLTQEELTASVNAAALEFELSEQNISSTDNNNNNNRGNGKFVTPNIAHLRVTPTSTPIVNLEGLHRGIPPQLSAIKRRKEDSEGLSTLETEVLRKAGDDGGGHTFSYEDPLRSSSHLISGDSLMASKRNSLSLTSSRFNDIVGGEGRPDLPLTLGSDLTPIPDVEEEMELSAGLDLPDLNDSDEIIAGSFSLPHSPHGETTSSSSPSIESKPSAYCSHVVTVMDGRSEMEFQELLPPRSTRKTASVAFSHVLILVSKYKFLTVKQTTPYGPITLGRGERF